MVFKNLEKRALGRWGRVNIDLPSWWHTTFVSPLPRSPLEGQFFFGMSVFRLPHIELCPMVCLPWYLFMIACCLPGAGVQCVAMDVHAFCIPMSSPNTLVSLPCCPAIRSRI